MAVDNPAVLRGGVKLGSGIAINAILDEDNMVSDSNEAVPSQQSVKAYVDNVASGYNRRNAVITIATSTAAPPTEVSGDRYILDNSGAPNAAWDGASQGDIVEFNGTTWDATTPSEGWVAYCDTDNKDALCVDDGTLQWELRNVAITNHNDLSNIDGGTTGEYYHMTSAQHTSIVGGSSDASSLHHHDGRYYTESEVDALLPTDGTAAGQMLHWSGSAWDNTETSELYWDDSNKRLGIGVSSPLFGLHHAGEDGTESVFANWRASTDTDPVNVVLAKSRGTVASPVDVSAGDKLGVLTSHARINSSWGSAALVGFQVAGTHTTYVSGDIYFQTRDSSNSYAERMRLTSTGRLGIGTDAPGGTLGLVDANTYITRDGSNNLSFTDAVTGTKTLAELASGVDVSGTPVDNQFAIWVDADTLEGVDNFTWDGQYYHIKDDDKIGLKNSVYSTTDNYPDVLFMRSRGTEAAKTAVQSGDHLGQIRYSGYYNSSSAHVGARIRATTAENWTVDNRGTYLTFETTAAGTNTMSEKMRLTSAGRLGIGVDSPTYGLQVESEDTSNSTIAAYRYNTSGSGAILRLYSAKGSQATPAAKADNDTLGNVVYGGYDGNSWEQGAVILSRADGAWTDTNLGTDITFHMCENGGTTLVERFGMESTGAFYMDQTSAPSTTTDRLYNVSGDLYWNAVKLNNDLSGYVDTTGTPADNQIAVFTDANTLEGDSDFIWDGVSLGIGTTSPIQGIEMVSEGSTQATNRAHVQIKAHKSAGDNINSSAWFCSFKANGTIASPTDLASGDSVGGFQAIGYDESTWKELGRIHWYADDTPGAGSTYVPGRCEIYTYDNSAEGGKWTFDHEGSLKFKQVSAPSTTTDKLYNVSGGLYWNGTQLGTSNVTDGTAAGQMAFWDGSDSWDPTETSEMFWDDTNKRLGLGTSSPDQILELAADASLYPTISGYGTTNLQELVIRHANGTQASPTAAANNDALGSFAIHGYYNSDWRESVRLETYANSATMGAYIPGRFKILIYNDTAEGGSWTYDHEGAITFKEVSAPSTTTNKLYNTSTGLYFDGTRLDIDSTTDSRLTSGTAAGQFLFWDGTDSWDPTEVSEMEWDDTNKRLGIGVTDSLVRHLEVAGDDGWQGSMMTTVFSNTAGAGGSLVLRKAAGTQASRLDVSVDDTIGIIQFHSYGNSEDFKQSAWIKAAVDDTVPAAAGGYVPGRLEFTVCDSTTTKTPLIIEHDGHFLLEEVSAPGTTTNRLYNTSTGLFFDGTRLDTSVNLVDGTAAGQMLFWNGSTWTYSETSEMYWDDTNKRLHVGTTNTSLTNIGDQNFGPAIYFHSVSDTLQPYTVYSRGRGSIGSVTVPLSGDLLGSLNFNAMFSNTGQIGGAKITVDLAEDAASNKAGSDMVFFVRGTGISGSLDERFRINNEGALVIAQTSAPGTTTNKLYNVSGDLYWDGTQLNTSANLDDGTAAGQLAFWNGSTWTYAETTEMVWDDTGKSLGIGVASPEFVFHLATSSNAAADKATAFDVAYTGTEEPDIYLRKARGSLGSEADVVADDKMGGIIGWGYIGSDYAYGAGILYRVVGTHTTYVSGQIEFFTRTSANDWSKRITIEQDGAFKMEQMSAPSTTTDRLYNVSGDLYWDGTQLNTTADSRLTSGTAAGQMLFWDGTDSWDPTETSELFWDDTNKRLSVGSTAPYSALELEGDSQLACSVTITEGSDTDIPFLFFRRSRGTSAARTNLSAGDALGGLHMRGWINSDWNAVGSLRWRVNATHTTFMSTYFAVYTNDTSNTNTERFRIEPDGAVKLTTSGKLYTDSNDLSLATETSGNIKLDSVGEIHFDDANISGWAQGYMKFSNASSEWTDFESNFGGEVSLLSAVNQAYENAGTSVSNTDVDTGTEDVDTFADTAAKGATWSYIVTNGTNHRGGIIIASWNATADTVTYTDVSTSDQGDTSQLSFSVDINSDNVRLRATATTDNWNVQAERNLIAKA